MTPNPSRRQNGGMAFRPGTVSPRVARPDVLKTMQMEGKKGIRAQVS